MLYGYIHISSKDQDLNKKVSELIAAGVEEYNIFIDKDFNCSSYQELIGMANKEDIIILNSINTLGQSPEEIQERWRIITETKELDVKVLDIPLLDTSYCKDILGTFISDLVLQILSFQVEQERGYIKQRQAEGIAEAKKKGIKFGRPRKALPNNFEELYERFRKNEPINRLAKDCKGMSESTLRLRLYERLEMEQTPSDR